MNHSEAIRLSLVSISLSKDLPLAKTQNKRELDRDGLTSYGHVQNFIRLTFWHRQQKKSPIKSKMRSENKPLLLLQSARVRASASASASDNL